jgi:hypothetical protein
MEAETSPNPGLYEFVTTFFSRKAIMMGPLGKPIPLTWKTTTNEAPLTPSMTVYISALRDAKMQLDSLIYQSYEVVRVGHLLSTDDYEMQRLKPKQQHHLKEVERWRDLFIPLCSHEQDKETHCLGSILLMYWGMCYIFLSACTNLHQTSFDKHADDFAAILDHVQVVLRHAASPETEERLFTYDIAIVTPPLMLVATKCREPILRRRALQLLRQAPRRDALWSSVAAPSVVEKVIAIEEGEEHFSEYPNPSLAQSLPPENRRIHHVAIVKGGESNGRRQLKVQLTKAVPDTTGQMKMVNQEVWVEDRIQSAIGKSPVIIELG